MPGERRWQKYANCRGLNPDIFFPERGEFTGHAKTEPVRAICEACEVVDACLDYALTNHIMFGIWGGKSERERRSIRRRSYIKRGVPAAPVRTLRVDRR